MKKNSDGKRRKRLFLQQTTAVLTALALMISCTAGMATFAAEETSAPAHWHSARNGCSWTYRGAYTDGNGQWKDWDPAEEMWVGNADSEYADYVSHNAVPRWGDVNHDTRGDVQDALILYLAASGDIEEDETWFDNFLRPSVEYFTSHPEERGNYRDDTGLGAMMYNALVVYTRVCGEENRPGDSPLNYASTTTTAATTTSARPTENTTAPDESTLNMTLTDPGAIEKLEDLVVYYINELRVQEGLTPALRLKKVDSVAKYRSKQLVDAPWDMPGTIWERNNAIHAYGERECAEFFKYGDFGTLFTDEGPIDTYNMPGSESAAKVVGFHFENPNGLIASIANDIALNWYYEKDHWEVIRSATYLSIGVTAVISRIDQYYTADVYASCLSNTNHGPDYYDQFETVPFEWSGLIYLD